MSVYNKIGAKQTDLYDISGGLRDYCRDNEGNVIPISDYAIDDASIISMTDTQGFAIYNGLIFQFRTPSSLGGRDVMNVAELYAETSLSSDISVQSGHGNSASFSDEFVNNDEFPLIYVSEDTTVYSKQDDARVFVNNVTPNSSELVKTYKFPLNQVGYYACLCLDYLNKIMYMIGYSEAKHNDSDGGNNRVIISKWDYSQSVENADGSLTPIFISSDTIDFIETMQGTQFYNDLIWVTSSAYDNTNKKRLESLVYAIDPESNEIVNIIHTKNVLEIEGIAFLNEKEAILGFQRGIFKKITFYNYSS